MDLIEEDMRRVVVYLIWKAEWWEAQAELPASDSNLDQGVKLGLSGYSFCQAHLSRLLAHTSGAIYRPDFV